MHGYLRLLAFSLLVATVLKPAGGAARQESRPERSEGVRTEMRNVRYHFTDTIAVDIRMLQGTLVPVRSASIPVFDDKRSFVLAIDAAEIAIAAETMGHVLNEHVFARPDAPLKKIAVSVDREQLKIKGVLHDKGGVPFELLGQLSATPEGKIRLRATKIKAAHLPAKGIMDLLGIAIADLVTSNKVSGVRAEGDDLILDPGQILPPPAILGRVTDVRIEGNQIVQTFGAGRRRAELSSGAANYMAYRGRSLRFGKLTMADTDLELIDMDPRDPFDFYLDHYKEQLVAGYTKTTPAFGLRVYMPDYNKMRHSRTTPPKPKAQ